MNIEKVKNYNQKLLAILGTFLVLIATIGLLMLLFFGISELVRAINYNRPDGGILSDNKIEKLQKENKRQQVISYDFPRLVDTLNSIYMIPIIHKDLTEAEFIDEEVFGLMDMRGSSNSVRRHEKIYYGSFNNLLIYDLTSKSLVTLFDERVYFNVIMTEIIENEIIILFTASSKDTNKDGVINQNDLKSLYVYSLSDKRLRKISVDHLDVQNYGFVRDGKDILIMFGIDYNKNGQYEELYEPSVINKYDFTSDELLDIVDESTKQKLQKLLEGSME
jgi:hypothetical protein